MKCTSKSLGAFLVSRCSSEGILPLRIGAASTEIYIERGTDWCGQGKKNSFVEGCGMSTCHYGTSRVIGQKLIVCAHSCTGHLFSAQILPKPLPKHFFTSFMQLI